MKKMNYCYECGDKLASGATKCDGCGKVYRRERGALSVSEILKRSLCLFVALLFLISAFTPIVYSPVGEKKDEAKVKISSADIIELAVASFNSYSDDELTSSKLYKNFDKATRKLAEYLMLEEFDPSSDLDYEDLSSEGRRLFKDAYIAGMKCQLASEYSVTSPALIIAAIVAMLYMLVCVGAFLLALISFIGGFVSALRKCDRLFRYTVKLVLLCAVGSFAALIAFSGALGTLGMDENVRLAGFALMGVVATLALCVALWIIRRVTGDERFNIATAIKRAVCLVVCFAAIMLCFAPLYKSSVKTEFGGSSKKSTTSFYYNYADFSYLMHDDEIDKIKDDRDYLKELDTEDQKQAKIDHMKMLFEQFSSFTLDDVKDGAADSADKEMHSALMTVSKSNSAYRVANLFTAVEITTVFAAVMLALAMYESLKYFAIGRTRRNLYRVYAACGAICALITVLLAVVYMVMLCGGLDYAPKGYSLTVAVGGIFFAVASVAAVCLPRGTDDAPKKESAQQNDECAQQNEECESEAEHTAA